MNIFYLSEDPREAAQMLCDKHLVKMVLEACQLLCTAHRTAASAVDFGADHVRLDELGCYTATHKNHPCAVWVRQSKANYEWAVKYFHELLVEFSFRYRKHHSCAKLFHVIRPYPATLIALMWTAPAQVMPEQYKSDDPVEAYRAYYLGSKHSIAKWNKGRLAPTWWR